MPGRWRRIVAKEGYNYNLGTVEFFANLDAVDAMLAADLDRANREGGES